MLFVTGTESFIGRALIARCKKYGIAVTGIDLAASASSNMVRADIRNAGIAELIPEGATVVHLAAISRDADCRANPQNAFDVNVNGTINVLAAAKLQKAQQVVFASTEWVYGEVADGSLQRESQPIDVTTIRSEYALTKIVGEQYLRLVSTLPATTVLRFGIVYGPRADNWSALESLVSAVHSKPEISVGSLATARRFIHVDDIVSGILLARKSAGFGVFNLCGDRPISLGEIIGAATAICGRTPRVVETDAVKPSIRNPDNGKARAELNWRPTVDLESGVREVCEFLSRR